MSNVWIVFRIPNNYAVTLRRPSVKKYMTHIDGLLDPARIFD